MLSIFLLFMEEKIEVEYVGQKSSLDLAMLSNK